MLEFIALRLKTYSCLIMKNKKQKAKGTKSFVIKQNLKHQLENEINLLKNDVEVDSLRKNYKEFVKNNRIILRSQQRIKRTLMRTLMYILKKLLRWR